MDSTDPPIPFAVPGLDARARPTAGRVVVLSSPEFSLAGSLWLALAILQTAILAGCNAAGDDAQSDRERFAVDLPRGQLILLEHHFGLLRPGDRAENEFTIENPTNAEWAFASVTSNCACTVTRPSAPTVPPGCSATLLLTYTAPKESRDDRREVMVHFREPAAPIVTLRVRARVRDAITLFPQKLRFVFTAGRRARFQEQHIEVHNYSGERWRDFTVIPSVRWLDVETVAIPVSERAGRDKELGPIERWRVVVRAAGDSAADGAELQLQARGASSLLQRKLPVRVTIQPAVRVIPGSLFFGRVPRGISTARELLVRFAPDVRRPDVGRIEFDHALGERLKFKWLQTTGPVWRLEARFDAFEHIGSIENAVTLRFGASPIPDQRLSVRALVVKE